MRVLFIEREDCINQFIISCRREKMYVCIIIEIFQSKHSLVDLYKVIMMGMDKFVNKVR